jgi:conjugative transfer pilus assembly protein TraH
MQERELIMSIVGTVIFYAEEDARDPEPIAPTITSISQLLYGQAAGAGTDVTQHLLRCNDYVELRRGDAEPEPTRTRRSRRGWRP